MVGAGSAGAAVAARLSEVPEWNVLLLEAGGDPPDFTEIPLKYSEALRSVYDWSFVTEPEERMYKGLEGNRSLLSRGLMLGGSSSMNAMMYLRGTKRDFDEWARVGNVGWGYDDVLPYFLKSEDYVGPSGGRDMTPHGRGGPLTVGPLESVDPAYTVISKAMQHLNMSEVADLNRVTPAVVGYGKLDATVRDGLRCSTLKAFLMPASNRSNLFVAKYVRVTRVLFDRPGGRHAVGVQFQVPGGGPGATGRVYCTREVILSAGVIMSPHVLMLSGVGPARHLRSLGISVVKDLPVGYNYRDHVSFPGLVFSDRKNRSMAEIAADTEKLIHDTLKLISKGIATLGLTNLVSFIKTRGAETEYPDVQFVHVRFPYNTTRNTLNRRSRLSNMFGFSDEVASLYDRLNMGSDIVLIIPINVDERSTGRISLRSPDPMTPPKIRANYLSRTEEMETMLRAIDFVVAMSQTDSFRDAGLVLERIDLPNCVAHVWNTRKYWTCALENIATTFYHQAGTCKMGPSNDRSAVVDGELRVNGVQGLRVIDSSIMPKVVSVNTNAATIMIAEKGSDMIKKYYGKLV